MLHRAVRQKLTGLLLCLVLAGAASCGRQKTERLLLHKQWLVYDVTPPPGPFNIEESNRAQELKDGFYKNAWFEFLRDSIFVASVGGKTDTGKYHISGDGSRIALFPKQGTKVYEQIEIRQLSAEKLSFNTVVANFHLVLHLKPSGKGNADLPAASK